MTKNDERMKTEKKRWRLQHLTRDDCEGVELWRVLGGNVIPLFLLVLIVAIHVVEGDCDMRFIIDYCNRICHGTVPFYWKKLQKSWFFLAQKKKIWFFSCTVVLVEIDLYLVETFLFFWLLYLVENWDYL